ncbi:unnamed protein product, partial [marine sediment metagenome]
QVGLRRLGVEMHVPARVARDSAEEAAMGDDGAVTVHLFTVAKK